MKAYRIYFLISVISAAFILGGFSVYDSARQKRLKSDALVQMETVSREIMQMQTPRMQVRNSSPVIEIPRSDMRAIMALDKFVGIDIHTEAITIPMMLSSRAPSARFNATAHFVRGTHRVEASLQYQDGQWVFTEFVLFEGQRAQ
jgi:hypothetical protein